MGKTSLPRLEEILFSSKNKTESARISALEKKGVIRKIATKLYTSNLEEEPAVIIKRNWYKILAKQYPGAVLSHRSALEFRPTSGGHIFLTYSYSRKVELPGLTIHLLEGRGAIDGDKPFIGDLYVSQESRALLENLQSSRAKGEESKALPQSAVEEKLEKIIQAKGDKALNVLRDEARQAATQLGMENEFNKLSGLISALLSTGESKALRSPLAQARILGEPFDASRIDLFENLYHALAPGTFPDLEEENTSPASYRNFAFFESYFSNYIEGTEFAIEEAREIISSATPIPTREEDSQDILGTYQIVSNRKEMSIVPTDADMLLNLLRDRHAILLRSRSSKKPGEFKDRNNRAGNSEFVDKDLVAGTLKKGFEWYSLLQHPFSKAAYLMFLISEVHPFLDGNGRIARVMMNAELTHTNFSKIIIPTVFREDYIGSLKQFTNQRTPDAYIRMLLRAWQFSANIYGENIEKMEDFLYRSDAFKEPKHGQLKVLNRIIISQVWSAARTVPYGKNVIVRSSSPGVEIQILNSMGQTIEKDITGTQEQIGFSSEEIAVINQPMIRFRTKGHTTEVEYQLS